MQYRIMKYNGKTKTLCLAPKGSFIGLEIYVLKDICAALNYELSEAHQFDTEYVIAPFVPRDTKVSLSM
jgi:hypothetical protein